MRPEKYDFSGWVTKNDIQCSDGRTILKDAFAPQNETYVPLVWAHDHDNPENTLGKIYLENRDEGVYGYGIFNNSRRAMASKEAVNHGDVNSLSIWANHLKQDNQRNVSHGKIREVSLVLAGANPGARIDFTLAHGDEDEEETQAVIYGPDNGLVLEHEDEKPENEPNNDNGKETDNPMNNEEHIEHAANINDDMTIKEAFEAIMDTLSEKEQQVVYSVIGLAAESNVAEQSDDNSNNNEETENLTHEEDNNNMKTNAFDKASGVATENQYTLNTLSHDDMGKVFAEAKRCGSLKEAVAHAEDYLEHSITDTISVDAHTDHILLPDPKAAPGQPVTIDRRQEWVKVVMNGVTKVPFARVKMFGFDITADEARAKGYITGTKKVEEVITMLRRSTDPTTIYKLQALDRDQMLDITDFNIVSYLRGEMEGKLDEELARAILIGDGRGGTNPDKIDETKIRPIWTDTDIFSVKKLLEFDETDTKTTKLKKFIAACVKSRKDYRGKGNPAAFMSEDLLADLLLMEDGIGHKLYADEAALARAMRVSAIVTVPQFEGLTRTIEGDEEDVEVELQAILVNLADYTLGNNKGGEKTMFEDFDIDYNKQKYLIETRKSGALTVPYSAIVIEAPVEEDSEG